ncbi:MAG TPA: rhomboid family intramembrane serine protease [Gemmataceae bacterium]|nr:rhomboid family intramembrane serine protease [Gemmataceae bacterium]
MRQLATLPSADEARALADYLLTLKIDTQLEKEPDGWAIWIRDEDHLPRARQELEEYQRNPSDPRYAAAVQTASSLRQRKQQEDAAYFRRQERFNRRMSGPIASQRSTVGLIVVCVVVFLLSRGGHDAKIVPALSILPYRFVAENMVEWRVLSPLAQGQIWRLVTPIFLHFDIMHLLFDMYMLYYLGGAIERRRGSLRFMSLVLVIAVASNLVQYYFGNPVVAGGELRFDRLPFFGGMSGVDYGLFGYIWMKARFQPELGLHIDPSTVILLMTWLVLCMTPFAHVIIGGGGVANGAHVGGLLAGMLIGYIPAVWKAGRSR